MKNKVIGLVMLIGVLFLAGCQQAKQSKSETQRLKVVTTFYPMYDFTKQVVGKNADVKMLIQNGVEPHDYEPSPKDIAKISDADVFIYSSKDMETWVASVLKNIDTKKTRVIEASKGIKFIEGDAEAEEEAEENHEHGHTQEVDPHVWLDPVLAEEMVTTISRGMTQEKPNLKAQFLSNQQTYLKKLQKLDADYKKAFQNATQRTFITQHAAFAYLAKRYDLTQVSIAGLSSDQEPSPSRMAEIQDQIEKEHTEVIYFSENSSDKIAKTLQQETGVKIATLNPLEGLSAKEQKAGVDYIEMMEQNLKALQLAIH